MGTGYIKEMAAELDNYYIPPRYPNAYSEGSPFEYFTRSMAERAVKMAEAIIRWVEGLWSVGN